MKQFVKKFNNLIKNTIFKVKNKTNNKLKISSFNKAIITFIGLLFLYLFYSLIPTLYDKNWLKDNIKAKLFKEFKLNLNFVENISYRILPAPHFIIKDSNLLLNNSSKKRYIAEIRELKIFLNKSNFFDKEKMKIEEVIINDANFFLLPSDFKELNHSINHKFSNKKIKINKSNIFFKNNLDEIITIIEIDKVNFFFDDKKLENQFNSKGSIFAIPFTLEIKNKKDLFKKKNFLFEERNFLFKAKSLNLNILNNNIKKNNNSTVGNNIISFFNSIVDTEYELRDKNIIFKSKDSKLKNYKVEYDGEISTSPFDLNLNIRLNSNKISRLFILNSTLIEFFKSGLLFNDNISLNTSITVNSNGGQDFFDDAKIYFNLFNGKINFDKTQFINKKIGLFEISDSSLFFDDDKLVLKTNLLFNITNSNNLFSFLNTSKAGRKEMKNILANIDYYFIDNTIIFNNIMIDNNKLSKQSMNILEGLYDNNTNNLVKTKRLLNKLFSAYAG